MKHFFYLEDLDSFCLLLQPIKSTNHTVRSLIRISLGSCILNSGTWRQHYFLKFIIIVTTTTTTIILSPSHMSSSSSSSSSSPSSLSLPSSSLHYHHHFYSIQKKTNARSQLYIIAIIIKQSVKTKHQILTT